MCYPFKSPNADFGVYKQTTSLVRKIDIKLYFW